MSDTTLPKRKASDKDENPSAPKSLRTHGCMFPSGKYHFRWNCPEQASSWKKNANVCDQCVCFVCNVGLRRSCHINAHKWAAPPEITQWVEERGVPEQIECVPPPQGVDTTGLLPLVRVTLTGDVLADEDATWGAFGVPVSHVAAYMSVPTSDHVWPMLSHSSLGIQSRANALGRGSVWTLVASTCVDGRPRRDMLGKMQTVPLVPERSFPTTFLLTQCKVGGRITALADIYVNRTMLRSSPNGLMHVLTRTGNNPLMPIPNTTDAPPNVPLDRPLFPHQLASLARMEFMEEHGLTHMLWNEGPSNPQRFCLINKEIGSVYVGQGEDHLPDASCRGGLLCNDRGTGKTCISASLISKRKAPLEWVQTVEAPIEPDSPPPPEPMVAPEPSEPEPTAKYSDDEESDEESDDDDLPPGVRAYVAAALGNKAPTTTTPATKKQDIIEETPSEQARRQWHAMPTPRTGATLVVVPGANLLSQWTDELTMLGLNVTLHYDRQRIRSLDELDNIDVVLTTSDTLRSAIASKLTNLEMQCCTDTIFTQVRWWRLIVDECHKMLQASSMNRTGSAIMWIRAHQRWGLTATPQITQSRCRNYLEFLYGVPTARSAAQNQIHHYVRYPGRYLGSESFHNTVFYPAISVLEASGEMVLPKVEFHNHTIRAPADWLERYKAVYERCRSIVKTTRGPQTTHLLNQLLMTIAGVRAMIPPSAEAYISDHPVEPNGSAEVPEDIFDCAICLQELHVPVRTACNHYFCNDCLIGWYRQQERDSIRPRCPNCRARLPSMVFERCVTIKDTTAAPRLNAASSDADAPLPPCIQKLDEIVRDLVTISTENNESATNPDERKPNRILCFSRFPALRAAICERISEIIKHTTKIKEFQESDDIQVLVLSPQSCGVGLNLMQANHVVLADPQFKRANEEQAYARAARIGQKRTVHVHRYLVDDTLEQVLHRESAKNKVSLRAAFDVE